MVAEDGEQSLGGDVADRVVDAANVLFLAPSMGGAADCLEVFAPAERPAERVLAVSYTGSADRWLERWREHVGAPPADLTVVHVGASTRSAAAESAGDRTSLPVQTLESPEDLTGLGITLGQELSTWADDVPTLVCYDSLTVLLQYVDLQRAFRFLHVLTGRVASATGDVQAHYHLDPSTCDEQTVATLSSLFDATVRYEDGEWRTTAR